jgi:hypothetical protein
MENKLKKTFEQANGIARHSKVRCDVIEEMEDLLLVSTEDNKMAGDITSEVIICE